MVISIRLLLVLAVLTNVILAQTICSSFCAQSGCGGWTPSDCSGKCNTAFGWSTVSGICEVTATTKEYIDSSQEAGGSIQVLPNTKNSCTGFPSTVDVPTYGQYSIGNTLTVTLGGGTTIPHYQIDLIFTFILIDEDNTGTSKWDNNAMLNVSLINTTTNLVAESQASYKLDGGNVLNTDKKYCGLDTKKDQYVQFRGTFTHNATDSIIFNVAAINVGSAAKFAVKEFIMVAVKCHVACLSCNASTNINRCFSCDIGVGYKLNNNSCLTTCTTGYGITSDPAVCIYCNLYCSSCYEYFDNCSACKSVAPWSSFLIENYTLGYFTCVPECGVGYFENTTSRTCDYCNYECLTCDLKADRCYSCIATYGWYNYTCNSPCQSGFFLSTNGSNCTVCNSTCISCLNQTYCYECTLNGTHMSYFLDFLCYNRTCPDGYYADTNFNLGPNTCKRCTLPCLTCTAAPNPCQTCDLSSFLLDFTCVSSCPAGYVVNMVNRECINCNINCVEVSIKMYFVDALSQKIYADVKFSRAMDFSVFDEQTFQTVSISNLDSSKYTVSYALIDDFSYRITIQPNGYVFLYNETVTILTRSETTIPDTSNDTTPFKPSSYDQATTLNWFLIKSPEMSSLQKSVINNLANINTIFAKATTAPFVAEIKKSGALAMLFSGAQLTTCGVFIKSIPAPNMYEGMRFWGIFVLYDVPSWQQNSKIPNKILSPDVSDLVKDSRRLFDMNTLYWRFHRTGQSSFFIYDVYMPLLLISLCWITALIAYCIKRSDKNALKRLQPTFYAVCHKIHEVSIMYLTIAMMMEWIYFDGNSGTRWLSLMTSLLFSGYFVCYELYIYYDMIRYPQAVIGSEKFQYYLVRYGSFLKNIRYQEYDVNQPWSASHWFRPYNYHFLSYYKKFCMLIALPIFYQVAYFQAAILMLIQLLEIIRFVKTNPFYSRWRTIFRFLLQLFIFLFFLIILILEVSIGKITDNASPTLNEDVKLFYNLGWVGFSLVFGFNGGFLVLFFIDVARGFKYNTRQLVQKARREYYYDKLKKYQSQNEQVPLGLMNKWVKFGNLNKRKHEQLPQINLRVQYYKLVKHNQYFDVQILKIVDLFLNINLNFHQENNTKPGKTIKKRIKLSKEANKNLYLLISEIFSKYAKKDTEGIIIKTYISIKQNEFKSGDKIPLIPDLMCQKLQLQDRFGKKKVVTLPSKLKGFPINAYELESI